MKISFDQQSSEQEWEDFLLSQAHPPFLQSWRMREVHTTLGENTISLVMRRGGSVEGVALCAIVNARRGRYLYLPYGPVCTETGWRAFGEMSAALQKLAKSQNVDFIRSSPFLERTDASMETYRENGWRLSPLHMLAEHVWWLDVTPSEDLIIAGMRKTMRNLIRKAAKMGVTVRSSTSPEDVRIFMELHKETVARHHFIPYPMAYFEAQVQAFAKTDQVRVFVAEYQGKPISAAIMMYYGDTGAYHHGASLSAYSKIPASYLLQWNAIQEAKARGCTTYNFWGVVPEQKYYSPVLRRPHPFIGVTTFKTGFGGEMYNLVPCHDLALTARYRLWTRPIERVRKWKRGF